MPRIGISTLNGAEERTRDKETGGHTTRKPISFVFSKGGRTVAGGADRGKKKGVCHLEPVKAHRIVEANLRNGEWSSLPEHF